MLLVEVVEVLWDVFQVELLARLEGAYKQDLGACKFIIIGSLLVEFPGSYISCPCSHQPQQGSLQQVLE